MNSKSINRSVSALTLSLCLGVIGYSLSAQAADPPTKQEVTPAFKAKLDKLTPMLTGIERRVESLTGRIQSARLITAKDMEDAELDKAMQTYADAMKAAYDGATADGKKAAETKGKEGNVANLKVFEDLAKSHEGRLTALEKKTRKIEEQLKVGTITLDKPILEKATPPERDEFRKFLKPEGLKLYPDLKGDQKSYLNTLQLAGLMDATVEICGVYAGPFLDLLISPAEAAALLPCVTPCWAQNWPACLQCFATAIPQGAQAFNKFKACWNGVGRPWWKPWWIWRSWCVTRFIVQLA